MCFLHIHFLTPCCLPSKFNVPNYVELLLFTEGWNRGTVNSLTMAALEITRIHVLTPWGQICVCVCMSMVIDLLFTCLFTFVFFHVDLCFHHTYHFLPWLILFFLSCYLSFHASTVSLCCSRLPFTCCPALTQWRGPMSMASQLWRTTLRLLPLCVSTPGRTSLLSTDLKVWHKQQNCLTIFLVVKSISFTC